MVIYNPEKKVLFIPEKDDYILFDPDEVYERGYAQGYEKGRAKAEEECEEKHNYPNKYFTIESRDDGSLTVPGKVSHYRKNDGDWIANSQDTLIQVEAGDKVEMKGLNSECSYMFSGATMPGEYICYGNIMSLLYNDDFRDKYGYEAEGLFRGLFWGCTGLTNASNLILQATTLSRRCYQYMFRGCTSLAVAPELPATTIEYASYFSMFHGCTSLTKAPALPAMTLGEGCYHAMFQGCTSLTTAPALPALAIAPNCYEDMFNGCTGLLTAPALPATSLTSNCYANMFSGCTSLTTAPELPAVNVEQGCYGRMFRGCSSLNYIKCLAVFTYSGAGNPYSNNWLDGVASSGTFVKDHEMSGWRSGASGIPNNWTIIDA